MTIAKSVKQEGALCITGHWANSSTALPKADHMVGAI